MCFLEKNQCNCMSEFLTIKEVTVRARCSRATLYRRWASGTGPRYVNRTRRLVRADWLDDWLLESEKS